MPSSTSQSSFKEPGGSQMSSFGPLMTPLCLLNTMGWPGAFRPASAAWSA